VQGLARARGAIGCEAMKAVIITAGRLECSLRQKEETPICKGRVTEGTKTREQIDEVRYIRPCRFLDTQELCYIRPAWLWPALALPTARGSRPPTRVTRYGRIETPIMPCWKQGAEAYARPSASTHVKW